MTSCAAALAALRAATAVPVLAVALSISSTNDYHFVLIPSNMVASIEGVGMGAVATNNAPLRYEDIVFLKEAIAERSGFFDGLPGTNWTVSLATKETLTSGDGPWHLFAKKLATNNVITALTQRCFVDPSIPMIDEGQIKDTSQLFKQYNYTTNVINPYFNAVFGSNNCVATFDVAVPQSSRNALNAVLGKYVASCYKALEKLVRPAGIFFSQFYTTNSWISIAKSQWDYRRSYTYNHAAGTWEAGELVDAGSSTKTNKPGEVGSIPGYSIDLSCVKNKILPFELTKDGKKWVPIGTAHNSEYSHEYKAYSVIPDLRQFNYKFAELPGRSCKRWWLVGFGKYHSYTYYYGDDGLHKYVKEVVDEDDSSEGKSFALILSSGTNCKLEDISFDFRTEQNLNDLVDSLSKHYGDFNYGSAEDMMEDVTDADSPPSNPIDYEEGQEAMGRTTRSGRRHRKDISITEFMLILDMNFSARVSE